LNPWAIILCGVPAAGKTTIRARLLSQLLPQQKFETVAPDDMIDKVADASGAFYRDIYVDLEARQVCYDAAWYRLDRAIREQKNVLIDRTHLCPSHRLKTLRGGDSGTSSNAGGLPLPALLPLYRCIAVTIDLPGSVHDWVARLDSRPGKTIPAHTLFGMVRAFTPPTIEEGFESVFQGGSDSDVAERAAAYIRENSL
jgi:hypothetical protein